MRARTRNLLLLAALLATAGLGLLLLPDGGREGGRDRTGEPTAGTRPASLPGGRTDSRPATRGGEGGAGSAVPDGPHLDLRAVVEGDWGLAGLQVLAIERRPDGTLDAWIGDDAPDGGETDGDGRITLRYKTEPRDRLFAVLKDEAVLGPLENADPVGELHGFSVFKARTADPVTLHYRDPEGLVLLRPVDAATGEILTRRAGVAIGWTWFDEEGVPNEEFDETVEKAPGWLRADVSNGPEARGLRLVVPGYLPSPAPEGGWKGRVVLPMKPDPAAVRGRIVFRDGTLVSVELRAASDGRRFEAPGLLGLPATAGPFVLSGVPQGEWNLVVRAAGDGAPRGILWAARRFSFHGTGLDLGDLVPRPGATLRARLTSAEGKPVTDAYLRLSSCVPGALPVLSYNRGPRVRDTVQVTWPERETDTLLADGEPDSNGWVEFAGLLPGATCLIATPRVPGLTRSATAPANPGEVLDLEIDGGCRLTPCVLHFTLEGEEPAFWRRFSGPAYADQFSTGKGILEAEIPPGRYRVLASGSAGPEPDYHDYEGEIDVPEGGRYEATVDLKRRRK